MLYPKKNNINLPLGSFKPISGNGKITINHIVNNQLPVNHIKLNDIIQQNTVIVNDFVIPPTKNIQNISSESSESIDKTYSTELVETENNSPSSFSSSDHEYNVENQLSLTDNTISELSEQKLYWEYGNTGLKITNFNKKMSKNLAILHHIDKMFIEYSLRNPNNNYEKLYMDNIELTEIFDDGEINVKSGKVNIKLTYPKLKGTYNILKAENVILSEIKFSNKDLKKNSIPNLESLLKYKDNLIHISKILKIFKLIHNTMNIQSFNNSFHNIINNANNIYDNMINNNKKHKLLKSTKSSGFYIKMYNDHGEAFVINNKTNTILYIIVNIDFDNQCINMRNYTLHITNGKIDKIK